MMERQSSMTKTASGGRQKAFLHSTGSSHLGQGALFAHPSRFLCMYSGSAPSLERCLLDPPLKASEQHDEIPHVYSLLL